MQHYSVEGSISRIYRWVLYKQYSKKCSTISPLPLPLYHCAMQSTVLHCDKLFYAALLYSASKLDIALLHFTALHGTALHCTALHCTALHCTAQGYILGTVFAAVEVWWLSILLVILVEVSLHSTELYSTVLHCTSLHYTLLYFISLH